MSNDPLTTLAAAWAIIETQFLLAGVPKSETKSARRLFYSGASSLLAIVWDAIETQEAEAFQSVVSEVQTWVQGEGVRLDG
jgi:hypothetical protein